MTKHRFTPWLAVCLIVSFAASAEDGTVASPGPVRDHFVSDLRECASTADPDLLPDIDAGLEFKVPGWPVNHPARSLYVCMMGKGWNRQGPLMLGGPNMDGRPKKNVVCLGGWYQGKESAADERIQDQCIHACARYWYYPQVIDAPIKFEPKDPDDDVKAFMPAECMP